MYQVSYGEASGLAVRHLIHTTTAHIYTSRHWSVDNGKHVHLVWQAPSQAEPCNLIVNISRDWAFTVVSNSPSNCLITFWCLLRGTCARRTCTYPYDTSYIRRLHIFILVIVCIRCHTARLEASPYDT